ncbi:ankyrin repeat domain-containing protein 39 homolog [Clytia hemisphaerica]|uniref:ankyrin repeat domain-containing protein 39 homolog n=1 Tax=Clytia hemisphaerica TaxID=252671 RepID=UPI0034D48E90
MSKIRQSIIRRKSKKRESLDDCDINMHHRDSKESKLTRTSSCVSREVLLHHAITNENYNSLTKVLESDVDVNCMRPPGIAPIHMACVAGNLKFVMALTEKGADINLKTSFGLSPLKLAFLFGHYDVSEHLIQLGSDPNEIKDGVQAGNTNDFGGGRREAIISMRL